MISAVLIITPAVAAADQHAAVGASHGFGDLDVDSLAMQNDLPGDGDAAFATSDGEGISWKPQLLRKRLQGGASFRMKQFLMRAVIGAVPMPIEHLHLPKRKEPAG